MPWLDEERKIGLSTLAKDALPGSRAGRGCNEKMVHKALIIQIWFPCGNESISDI
jgi:hypothetical protein